MPTTTFELLNDKRRSRWYLAGPMTGIPEYNFPAFERAKADLESLGFHVLSPHEVDHGESPETRGSLPYATYLRAGLKLLLECDGIIMLPGWMQSTGARTEFVLAAALGMAAMQYDGETGALAVIE